jgi:hypothetical protein
MIGNSQLQRYRRAPVTGGRLAVADVSGPNRPAASEERRPSIRRHHVGMTEVPGPLIGRATRSSTDPR